MLFLTCECHPPEVLLSSTLREERVREETGEVHDPSTFPLTLPVLDGESGTHTGGEPVRMRWETSSLRKSEDEVSGAPRGEEVETKGEV